MWAARRCISGPARDRHSKDDLTTPHPKTKLILKTLLTPPSPCDKVTLCRKKPVPSESIWRSTRL